MCQHKISVLLYSWILWARAQAEGVDSAPPGGPGSQREDWSDWDPTELSIRQRRWGLSLWPAAPSFQKRERVRRASIPEKQEEAAGPFPIQPQKSRSSPSIVLFWWRESRASSALRREDIQPASQWQECQHLWSHTLKPPQFIKLSRL